MPQPGTRAGRETLLQGFGGNHQGALWAHCPPHEHRSRAEGREKKTPLSDAQAISRRSEEASEHYERLRPQSGSLDDGGALRWGRGLLLWRGMAAWLDALSLSAAPMAESCVRIEPSHEILVDADLPVGAMAHDDAVGILSEMVLSCCTE